MVTEPLPKRYPKFQNLHFLRQISNDKNQAKS